MAFWYENNKLQEQLLEAGNRLLWPPASVHELLPLLDQVESCLSRVEQSPSKQMQQALSPSLKALVLNGLIKHPDMDVRVSVASCISEITRITAPEAPYDDRQMKDVFQLIVSSFEKLSDISSRSYNKRTSILTTFAKVRSCVVMLDLECDALILEMFQHFFKVIRNFHPENVFSSMETIMTLVLEESEDISQELLSPILAGVKKNNKEVLPIARRLGEKVIGNCACKVISNICYKASGTVKVDDINASGEHLDGGIWKVGKKVDTSHENKHEPLKKQKQKRRSSTGKTNSEKDATNTAAKDVDKETVSLSRSASKSAEHEDQVEDTPEMNSRRTHTPTKEKPSDSKEYGENLVGFKDKVWYEHDASERRRKVFEELQKIKGLGKHDCFIMGTKIISDPIKLDFFFSLPENERAKWAPQLQDW